MAIFKHDGGFEHETTVNKSIYWLERRPELRASGLQVSASNHSATLLLPEDMGIAVSVFWAGPNIPES